MKRYFEFVDEKASKFWEVDVDAAHAVVRYGRIGSDGREIRKSFGSSADAWKFANAKAAQKLTKGYAATRFTVERLAEAGLLREATASDAELLHEEMLQGNLRNDGRVHDGNLRVPGDLGVSEVLLVDGDLDVGGLLATGEAGILCVTGDLRVGSIYLEGFLGVYGATRCDELMFGFYEAGVSTFEGPITGRLAVIGDHAYDPWGAEDFDLKVEFNNFRGLPTTEQERLREVVTEEGRVALNGVIGLEGVAEGEWRDAWQLLREGRFFTD